MKLIIVLTFLLMIISILLSINQLSSSSSADSDLCKALAPNGKYQPIGAYRRWFQTWHMDIQYNDSYWMWNREKEWQFRLNFDNTNRPIDIELVANSVVNSVSTSIVNRFTTKRIIWGSGQTFFESYYCMVYYKDKQNKTVVTHCLSPPSKQTIIDAQFPADSLIFSPFPGYHTRYTIIVNRKDVVNDTNSKYYYIDSNDGRVVVYDQCGSQGCRLPVVFQTLSVGMFRLVTAIVDFDYGLKRQGYVIFFTKKSKPYYCFATLTELSRECKWSTDIKKLAPECTNIWPSNAITTTTTTTTVSNTTTASTISTSLSTPTSTTSSSTTIINSIITSINTTTSDTTNGITNSTINDITSSERPTSNTFSTESATNWTTSSDTSDDTSIVRSNGTSISTSSDTTITTTLVVDNNNNNTRSPDTESGANRSSYLLFYIITIVSIIVVIILIAIIYIMYKVYESPKPSDDNKLDKTQSRVPSEIRAKVGQMDTDWTLHVDNISTESIKSKMS